MNVHPMQMVWRFAFVMLGGVGLIAMAAVAAEATGIVASGRLLEDAGDAERWVAFGFGALVQPFAWSALAHARLSLTDDELRYLGFGLLCRSRAISWRDVRRWGHATARNENRREPMLIFELQDGSTRTIKLAMYARQQQVRDELTRRLGPATPAKATITGVQFDE